MQLYNISDEYVNYLRKKFPRVYSNKENKRVHTRKNAQVLYSKRKAGKKNRVVENCLDFKALEAECDKWKMVIKTKYSVTEKSR